MIYTVQFVGDGEHYIPNIPQKALVEGEYTTEFNVDLTEAQLEHAISSGLYKLVGTELTTKAVPVPEELKPEPEVQPVEFYPESNFSDHNEQ